MLIEKRLKDQETIWISDDPDFVRECLQEKRPAIGLFSESECKDWSGVPYLVTEVEDIPDYYFKRVLDRLAGRPFVVAETERIVVREMTVSDLDALFEIYREENDPIVREEEAVRQRFGEYVRDTYEMYGCGIYGVFLQENGALIGVAGAEPKERDGDPELLLGYLIRQKMRGLGYASEAVRGVFDYLTEEFPDVPVVAEIEAKNKASLRVAGKLPIQIRLL